MHEATARPLANRGVELLALGRPREALQALSRAGELFLAAGDRLFAAQCQGDRAQAHRQLGELVDALRLLEPARRTLEELGAAAEAARLQIALAETYLSLGLPEEASAAASAAATATATAGMTHDLAAARFLVALADVAGGRPERGLAAFAAVAEQFAQVNDRQFVARVHLAEAEAAAATGRSGWARRALAECAAELRAGGWTIPLVWAHLRLADLSGDVSQAADHLGRAAPLVEELHVPELTYQHQLRLGRLRRRAGDVGAAEDHLRTAVAELERVSGALPDHILLAAFRTERLAAHAELVDLLVQRSGAGDLDRAAAVADAARARTLVDLLGEAVGAGPELGAGGRELAAAFADLNAAYLSLQQATEPRHRAVLGRQAEALERRVGMLRLRQVAASAPSPSPMGSRPIAPSGAPPAPGGTVIAYHAHGSDLAIFVRSGGGPTQVRRLPGSLPEVHRQLDQLAGQWRRAALSERVPIRAEGLLRATVTTLQGLYALLIAPVEDLIAAQTSSLCIVPHGLLGPVPFHALHDGAGHVVERYPVVIAPNLAAAGYQDAAIDLQAPALVVAVPDALAPAVADEARLIADLLPNATVLIGPDATAEAVVAASPGARVIHLACHGVQRDGRDLFARVRLGDRWMTAAEVVHLDLDGALVTLSACDSGVSSRTAEPVGLGWAFLAAGATGVLVSQWMVHDEAALVLMTQLYRRLAAGVPPAQALRAAQLYTAGRYPHPFHWAPFSFIAQRPGSPDSPDTSDVPD